MASKKEIQKRLEEQKRILAAYHNKEREAEKEMQGGSLPYKHKQIKEVERENPKKRRADSKQEMRRLVKHGGYDEY